MKHELEQIGASVTSCFKHADNNYNHEIDDLLSLRFFALLHGHRFDTCMSLKDEIKTLREKYAEVVKKTGELKESHEGKWCVEVVKGKKLGE
jgi:hypothetical protein